MTAPWHKVLRDVWRERTRASLVVMAIAIGLAGFLAVLSTYAILRRELNSGYLATNPASAVLLTDAIDEALLASIVARDDVSDADARRVLRGRIRTGSSEWRRLVIFVVRDFRNLRISTVTSEAGEWPPAPGGLLIERDAFQVAKAAIDDIVTIETPSGREQTLRVAGRVHDAGQAQARMENIVYGYITQATLAALGETPALDRLYLLVSKNRFDEAHVNRVAADVKAWLEAGGHPVRRMDVPEPGEHPHAAIMGVLLLAMAVFGIFILVLSGVIVVNLLLATMAAESRQIGVMKAIGGTRGQIACIYLAEAALFGVAAVTVAAAPGVVGGRVLSQRFAVLLNFDLATLAVPVWVYLLVAVVGLLVPLVAAAYPVFTGIAITVRAAIADSGVNPVSFGSGRLDRLICSVGGAGRPLLLGVRNSVRRRTRTVLTLVTLAAAGAYYISALSIRASMITTLDRRFGAGTFGADNRYAWDQHMLMIYVFLVAMSCILAGVGGLGLTTTMSLNVLERRRELGVLRAIGATPRAVCWIVAVEALAMALLSFLLAALLAWPVGKALTGLLLQKMFRLAPRFAFEPLGLPIWLAVSLALGAIASLVPAWHASRRPIREAIGYE
jgi:putative ABC transport system permease protein